MSVPALPDVQAAVERRQRLEERRLTDHAYAQRRAMLVMAAVTFALAWGGIRLSSIEALGLEITAWNERYLLMFGGLVLGYLIGNFATLAEPAIAAWRADFEWFSADVNRVVAGATEHMTLGAAGLRQVINEATAASGKTPEQARFLELLDRIESTWNAQVHPRAKRYVALHRARLRFEYGVPVGISLFVLYALFVRLALFQLC